MLHVLIHVGFRPGFYCGRLLFRWLAVTSTKGTSDLWLNTWNRVGRGSTQTRGNPIQSKGPVREMHYILARNSGWGQFKKLK